MRGIMSREYDDDERPSWREIDKKREKSSHVTRERSQKPGKPGADRWNTGRHKKALEKLFLGDKGTVEHEKLYNKIHKSYGTSTFLPSVQKYIVKYGPPDDVSTLMLLLDSKDPEVMTLAIDKLQAIFGDAAPREKEDAKRKLSIVALTEKSPDVKERAAEVLDELKTCL
jgi:hypothetical protein